jgi:hypothetical protein
MQLRTITMSRRSLALVLIVLVLAGNPPRAAAREVDAAWPPSAARQPPIAGADGPFRALFAVEPPSTPPAPIEAASLQDPTAKPAKPPHTGVKALVQTTAADFNAFPRRTSTYVILGIGAAAAALALPIDDEVNEHLKDSNAKKFFAPGKVVGYSWVQLGAAVGTYVIGRYAVKTTEGKTNKISHIGFDLLRANLLTQALTYGVKVAVRRDRPTGECCSFPSGHAAVTFASASVLERHFGYRAAWPTFVIGGYVAASRLFDNRHFLSDVLFGSALGIASGWTVVGRHGRNDYTLVPVPTRGGAAVAFMWTPGVSRDRRENRTKSRPHHLSLS